MLSLPYIIGLLTTMALATLTLLFFSILFQPFTRKPHPPTQANITSTTPEATTGTITGTTPEPSTETSTGATAGKAAPMGKEARDPEKQPTPAPPQPEHPYTNNHCAMRRDADWLAEDDNTQWDDEDLYETPWQRFSRMHREGKVVNNDGSERIRG
ncbi:hypothetical protein MMC30_006226 [Trapelia coarctata]|nr:hypothetical protein [Trapelia coarctata]